MCPPSPLPTGRQVRAVRVPVARLARAHTERTGHRVRLSLAEGEYLVEPHVLGRNRAGRTLLRAFLALTAIDGGAVRIAVHPLTAMLGARLGAISVEKV